MRKALCSLLAMLLPATAIPAKTVTIPFGTTVFCELDQRVTSRQKDPDAVQSGDVVEAHVWKDVWVDGYRVIAAGTPVYAKVARMKKARLAGQKGSLELEVLNVPAVDRTDVALGGGYDRSGRGRMGVTIGLAVALAWPFVFIKGKNAFLEPGTIFDAVVRAATKVEVVGAAPPEEVVAKPALEVSIPYEEIDLTRKIKELPLSLRIPEGALDRASVVAVNGARITPLQIALVGDEEDGVVRAVVDFKLLSKHFQRGMNRFEVEVGELRSEVVLEIEF